MFSFYPYCFVLLVGLMILHHRTYKSLDLPVSSEDQNSYKFLRELNSTPGQKTKKMKDAISGLLGFLPCDITKSSEESSAVASCDSSYLYHTLEHILDHAKNQQPWWYADTA